MCSCTDLWEPRRATAGATRPRWLVVVVEQGHPSHPSTRWLVVAVEQGHPPHERRRPCCLPPVGTRSARESGDFGTEYLACVYLFPMPHPRCYHCRRRVRGRAVGWTLLVRLFHSLLQSGLSRRFPRPLYPSRPPSHLRNSIDKRITRRRSKHEYCIAEKQLVVIQWRRGGISGDVELCLWRCSFDLREANSGGDLQEKQHRYCRAIRCRRFILRYPIGCASDSAKAPTSEAIQ